MLLSEIQTRVKNQFGDTSGAIISDADIARWASDAQNDIVRKAKCNEVQGAFLTSSTTNTVLITDMLDVLTVKLEGTDLRHYTRQQLNTLYPNRNVVGAYVGTPTAFFITEGAIQLFPTPDTTGAALTVLYNKRPSPVVNPTDALDIPEQYHEDVVVRCLQRAYETDGQWQAADRKGAEFKSRVEDSAHEVKHKHDDTFPAIRVLPGDYGDA